MKEPSKYSDLAMLQESPRGRKAGSSGGAMVEAGLEDTTTPPPTRHPSPVAKRDSAEQRAGPHPEPPQGPLLGAQGQTHAGDLPHAGRSLRELRRVHPVRVVHAVDLDAAAVDSEVDRVGEPGQGGPVLEGDAALTGDAGDGPV